MRPARTRLVLANIGRNWRLLARQPARLSWVSSPGRLGVCVGRKPAHSLTHASQRKTGRVAGIAPWCNPADTKSVIMSLRQTHEWKIEMSTHGLNDVEEEGSPATNVRRGRGALKLKYLYPEAPILVTKRRRLCPASSERQRAHLTKRPKLAAAFRVRLRWRDATVSTR